MRNPFKLLADLTPKPALIPSQVVTQHLSAEDKTMLRRVGIVASQLSQDLQAETAVNYDRARFYSEITRAMEHPLIGAALGLYADYSSMYNHLHNASVWATSENPTYQKELTKLLDRIGIEEKIFDWAFTVGSFGDLFVKVEGLPELGVINVNDDAHPLNYSRVDHQGVLIGFYETPQGQSTNASTKALIPPWEYVHLRLLGAKRKRPIFSDPMYSEFRTMHLMTGTDTKMVTSRYGVSLLIDALPTYKRLRLAEDSLLLARLTRGILRYVWKLKVDSQNMEAVGELVDQYATIIKRARAIDTRANSANFDEKFGAMCLRGDTKIELCDEQSLTIKELTENSDKYIGKSVWSVNPVTLHVESKKILSAQKTRLDAELVRVHLDNDKYIDATPDHRFLTYFGSYVEAQQLLPNTSLKTQEQLIRVVRVERLQEREDTYDITVEGNHNFALSVGVFVHNSAVEDLFIPVWGNTGDLTFDKIGGEVDIKWIVDIEDLRNQLACALRTPLQLLGGYVQESSGQLGSQAIEQLDVGFARSARRLQRAVKEGIRRICQIHLAYMNMDPDPRLFDVHMSETSTAEETAIRDNLLSGIDAVDKVIDTLEKVDPNLDKKGIVNYLNQKILKLDDFDINKFIKSGDNVVVESKVLNEAEVREQKLTEHFVVTNTDITSFLPILEKKGMSFMDQTWLQKTTCAWNELYQNTLIKENISTNSDDKNQLNLNF